MPKTLSRAGLRVERVRASSRRSRLVWIGWLGLVLFLTPGCGGCRDKWFKRSERQPDEQVEKPKPDFESEQLQLLPRDDSIVGQVFKPGHWLSVVQQLKSNSSDFYGQLDGRIVDPTDEPMPLTNSPFRVDIRRTVSLPKGQAKSFELSYFPPDVPSSRMRIGLKSELRPAVGGLVRDAQQQTATRLLPYQNHLVVLARRPDSYGFLKSLDAIKQPTGQMTLETVATTSDYVVVLPQVGKRIPLPSWPLMWTSIAYIVWDDFDAGQLSPDQQRCLVDWLHWGGQLIVSGPPSLDSMKSSFLADYLPAEAKTTEPMTAEDIAELSATWSVDSRYAIHPTIEFGVGTPLEVVRLELHPAATFVSGTGQMVAERRVGRGRIVTTAFRLTSRSVLNWDKFDDFFNGCLLRRPPRQFGYSDEYGVTLSWAGEMGRYMRARDEERRIRAREEEQQALQNFNSNLPLDYTPELSTIESGKDRVLAESLINSKLRYFSRDVDSTRSATQSLGSRLGLDVDGYQPSRQGGVAAWNDYSPCSVAVRSALADAAGISVPDRTFVFWTLGLYLMVLVPINWALFRALGRVEWAWWAVPLIALMGTVFVVRMAQLDIGFARSRSEVAIVETQSGYSRAHVTRYAALYSSLSTNYSLGFDDESALALPFAITTSDVALRSPRTVGMERLDKRDEKLKLDNFNVMSTTTEMIHAEQMLDLGGAITLVESAPGRFRVTNQSPLTFRSCFAIRRSGNDIEYATLGTLMPDGSYVVPFRKAEEPQQWFAAWRTQLEGDVSARFEVNLFPLVEMAINPDRLNEGDAVLIGISDQELDGMQIRPASSQQTFRTLLIANLAYGDYPPPVADLNSAVEFRKKDQEADDRID